MKIDKILKLGFFALLVIGLICMANSAVSAGIFLWVIAIPLGFVWTRVYLNLLLRHDIAQLSKNHSTQEILTTVEAVMVESKWSSAVGPG
ncbi:MAG: hypothetical protein WA125_15355, partial [Desulfosporosinus sp.]